MLEIILIAFLSYRNSVLARQKGQSPWLWIAITMITSLITALIGFMIIVFFFVGNGVDWQNVSRDPKYFEDVQKQLQAAFLNNPVHELALYAFACGGYLLMRYLLERMPDQKEKKNEPEQDVNWMDKYKPEKEQ